MELTQRLHTNLVLFEKKLAIFESEKTKFVSLSELLE